MVISLLFLVAEDSRSTSAVQRGAFRGGAVVDGVEITLFFKACLRDFGVFD